MGVKVVRRKGKYGPGWGGVLSGLVGVGVSGGGVVDTHPSIITGMLCHVSKSEGVKFSGLYTINYHKLKFNNYLMPISKVKRIIDAPVFPSDYGYS